MGTRTDPDDSSARWTRLALWGGVAFPVLLVTAIALLSQAWPADLRRPTAELYGRFTNDPVVGLVAEGVLRGSLVALAAFVAALGTMQLRSGETWVAVLALVGGSTAMVVLSVGAMALDTGAHMAICAAPRAAVPPEDCGTGQLDPQLFEALSSLGFYSSMTLTIGPFVLLAASLAAGTRPHLPRPLRPIGAGVAVALAAGTIVEPLILFVFPVFLVWLGISAGWMAVAAGRQWDPRAKRRPSS